MKNKDEIVKSQIEKFGELFQQGIQCLADAAKVLVELLDADPEAGQKLRERFPSITPSMFSKLEQVGRGVMHPRLINGGSAGLVALSRMPYSDQVKHLEKPLELLVETETGTDKLLVMVENLTGSQSRQIFAHNHIRSQGEQKAWLQEEKMRQQMKAAKPDETAAAYRILKDHTVEFTAGAKLTAADLAGLLQQLTR